ncbi:hypothetical protein Agub_g10654, partial [Astrephomene gubernaculifera]
AGVKHVVVLTAAPAEGGAGGSSNRGGAFALPSLASLAAHLGGGAAAASARELRNLADEATVAAVRSSGLPYSVVQVYGLTHTTGVGAAAGGGGDPSLPSGSLPLPGGGVTLTQVRFGSSGARQRPQEQPVAGASSGSSGSSSSGSSSSAGGGGISREALGVLLSCLVDLPPGGVIAGGVIAGGVAGGGDSSGSSSSGSSGSSSSNKGRGRTLQAQQDGRQQRQLQSSEQLTAALRELVHD